MIGTIFYLLGSINFFLDSGFINRLSIKIIIMIGMILSMITYQDLYKSGGKITTHVVKRFIYFAGLFVVLVGNVYGYTKLMGLLPFNIDYW